ncbi:LppP/LprE family lipoprotein [Nocardia sp. NPDC052566]|uniref:LppP/LprE family lipoprotein n=1 Tax=Nocardia sp. NPDC052566 TaxID=3364330 RepID=UPI0037C842EE
MKAKSLAVAALAAGIALATGGCGTTSSDQGGVKTTVAAPASSQPGSQPGSSTDQGDTPGQPTTKAKPTAGQQDTAQAGSGHGLCFDVNSELAKSAINRLTPPAGGAWRLDEAGEDPISAGCDGVLSWMSVESGNNHPYVHVLFFTGGKYLGTATAKPYGYTKVTGKTRNTVSVQYKWLKPKDALCCPEGGPSVVTFTLKGTTVQANGQFPPDN